MNPVSEASEKHKDELLTCQQEVLRLRERIRLLEEGHVHDLTQNVNERITGTTSKEIEGMCSIHSRNINIPKLLM